MKRIISLIMAVLMLCALCVPAMAEIYVPKAFLDEVLNLANKKPAANETSRNEFMVECMELIYNELSNKDLDPMQEIDARISYFEKAGDYLKVRKHSFYAFTMYEYAYMHSYIYKQAQGRTDNLLNKLADSAEPAVSQMIKEGDPVTAYGIYNFLACVYSSYLNDQTTAEKYFMAEVELLLEAAEKAQTDGNRELAINLYETASAVYASGLNDEESAAEYQAKADELRAENDSPTGSTLSEGSMTVVVGVACLAVGFLAAMLIFKKKKPALANGKSEE